MSATPTTSFNPPGPGAWELETTHGARPVPRFSQQPILDGFGLGFSESTARYGLLLDRIDPQFVNDFTFTQAQPFGAPKGAKGPPPKFVFQLITRLLPKLRARIRASKAAFDEKVWRQDLKLWDETVRPAADKRHRELQAVDLSSLSDEALLDHLRACSTQCAAMHRQHHRFTVSCVLPLGDLLVHVHEWTGKAPGDVLQVLRGSSRISCGVAAAELDALGAAIRADESARAILANAGEASATFERLKASGGAVATALSAYLDVVSYRAFGYDVGGKYALEMPHLLVEAIRASVDGSAVRPSAGNSSIEVLRKEIPEQHRAQFDELLEEAQVMNRLRDERGHHSDSWAVGLARRALLETGRRLLKRGAIDDAELAVDASLDELCGLMAGKTSPTLDELRRRSSWRASRTTADADVPKWLGAEPAGPPPAEWLPEAGRRGHRAIGAALSALFTEPTPNRTAVSVTGMPVSPGIYEGIARLVETENDFGRIQRGDVLVTRSTSPYFNVVLPLLGAIVTDRGGQLCHAAIVSREYGIPGVVGTREATSLVKDGARVRVDGTKGEVTVLE